MGIRNLTMVYKDGEYKIANFGGYDGDPRYVGKTILRFLNGVDLNKFKSMIDKVSYYTQEEFNGIKETINKRKEISMRYEWEKDFPQLSDVTGGDILHLIMFKDVLKTVNRLNFAADSFFCDWGYVIDLDKNTFEIYLGSNQKKLNETDRFYFLEKKSKDNYYPIRLLKSYSLDDLPSEELFFSHLYGLIK